MEPPEAVHGHHLLQYVAVLDLFQNQSRCCYTIHSPAIDELRIAWGAQGFVGKLKLLLGLPIIRKLEASLLHRSSALTALSSYTTRLIADHYGDAIAQKIQVIPGWADTEQFKIRGKDQTSVARQSLGWPMTAGVLCASASRTADRAWTIYCRPGYSQKAWIQSVHRYRR